MRMLPFVIWVLGWPVCANLTDYLFFLSAGKVPGDVAGPAAVVWLIGMIIVLAGSLTEK